MGQKLDGPPVVGPEPGGVVGDPAADQEKIQKLKDPDPDPPAEGRAKTRLAKKAGADHQIGPPFFQGGKQLADFRGQMLAVAIELHGDPIMMPGRKLEPRLHRPADPEVFQQIDDQRLAGGHSYRGSLVAGTIIHHQDIKSKPRIFQIIDHPGNAALFIVSRNNRQNSSLACRPPALQQPHFLDQFLVLFGKTGDNRGQVNQEQKDKTGGQESKDDGLVGHPEQVAQAVNGVAVQRQVKETAAHRKPEQRILLPDPPVFYQSEDEKKDEQAEKDGKNLDLVDCKYTWHFSIRLLLGYDLIPHSIPFRPQPTGCAWRLARCLCSCLYHLTYIRQAV